MYAKSAPFYDAIYRAMGKDYAREATVLRALADREKRSPGARLLDVACGTGLHLRHLRDWFEVEGMDVNTSMLELARERLPEVPIHQADLCEFDLGHGFDVVTCLFSSIGYARTLTKLQQAVASMAAHLEPGGLLVIEPWLTPETWQDGHLGAVFVDEPELKVARMNVSRRKGRISIVQFEYLVGLPEGIQRFTERHELGLFSTEDYVEALAAAGLEAGFEEEGLTGRGLHWGRRPV